MMMLWGYVASRNQENILLAPWRLFDISRPLSPSFFLSPNSQYDDNNMHDSLSETFRNAAGRPLPCQGRR